MDNKLKLCGDYTTWSNVPFEDIVDRVSAQKKSSNLPYVEFEDIISGEGILNKNIYERHNVKNGIYFVKGDVLFGKLRPYLKNILLANFNGIAVGDFWVLRSHRVLPYILYLVVNSNKFMRIANISSGSKMPRSDWAIVSKAMITIPESTEEQQKIASYFQSLDSLIQTTSKELTSLKQIKAASLQSMFPQEGETVPKVRFKGFEGEWSLKCVSELLCERNELSPQSPEFPLMAFIANNGITEKGERYDRSALVNDVINKQYKRTYYGDFIYSSNNLETGSIGLNTYGKATISPVYSIFYCTLNSDSNFVGYCMTRKSFIKEMIKWRQGVMYGQWRIHEKDFLRIKVLVPSLPEQQKIGAYFRSLDRQISLQTQRLEKLKQIKAACLNKMFV